MSNGFIKFVKDCFTVSDGQSGDIGRVLWAFGVLSFVFFEGWIVITRGIFDPMVYATAFSALLVAGATNLLIKKTTEPTLPPAAPEENGTKTVELTTKKTITVEKDADKSADSENNPK